MSCWEGRRILHSYIWRLRREGRMDNKISKATHFITKRSLFINKNSNLRRKIKNKTKHKHKRMKKHVPSRLPTSNQIHKNLAILLLSTRVDDLHDFLDYVCARLL